MTTKAHGYFLTAARLERNEDRCISSTIEEFAGLGGNVVVHGGYLTSAKLRRFRRLRVQYDDSGR